MKKIFLGLTGLIVLVFVVVLTVSAQDKTVAQDEDQVQTEVVAKTGHCGSSASCTGHTQTHKAECDETCTGECDHENCDENCTGKCDHKAGSTECTAECKPEVCHTR